MRFPFQAESFHSLLEAIVESSDDAIFSKTLGGLVLSWNSGAKRIYGYSAHEMIGQSVLLLVPEDRRQELATILHRLAEGQRVAPFETVRRRKDGSLVDVSITISPVRDATGKILGASTIARDIAERKQAEERQRLLDEASTALVSSLDHQITLQEITQLIVPAFVDYCRIALVDEQQQIKEIAANHTDPEKIALVGALYDHSKDRASVTYSLQELLQTGQPELLSHMSESMGAIQGRPELLALFTASQSESGQEEVALVGMAEALATLVEACDHLTGHHCHQVAVLVLQLALALGWPAAEAQMLTLAARLHDIGKVAVPDTVLQKPDALTEEEWDLVRRHSVVGAEVVSHIPALRPLAPVIRAHHERWDGQGYPDQLAGEAIPLGARILMVADAYLAMTVGRPYRQACAPAVALAELRRCAGSQFDPQLVEVLTRLLRPQEEEVE